MAVVDAVVGLVLLSKRSSIGIAVGIIKEASRATLSMPTILLAPILPNLFMIPWSVMMCYVCAGLASIDTQGTAVADPLSQSANHNLTDTLVQQLEATKAALPYSDTGIASMLNATSVVTSVVTLASAYSYTSWAIAFVILSYLWVAAFLQGVLSLTIAGAVSEWYWQRADTLSTQELLSYSPLAAALYRTLRYHLGSASLGALILSLVRLLRIAMVYVEREIRTVARHNSLLRVAACWCVCGSH